MPIVHHQPNTPSHPVELNKYKFLSIQNKNTKFLLFCHFKLYNSVGLLLSISSVYKFILYKSSDSVPIRQYIDDNI